MHEPDATVVPGVGAGFVLGDYGINTDVWLSRVGAFCYFAWFLLVVPFLPLFDEIARRRCRPDLDPCPLPSRLRSRRGATAAPEKKG